VYSKKLGCSAKQKARFSVKQVTRVVVQNRKLGCSVKQEIRQ